MIMYNAIYSSLEQTRNRNPGHKLLVWVQNLRVGGLRVRGHGILPQPAIKRLTALSGCMVLCVGCGGVCGVKG